MACMHYNKKGQESQVKEHFESLPKNVPNLGHRECYTPLNRMYF